MKGFASLMRLLLTIIVHILVFDCFAECATDLPVREQIRKRFNEINNKGENTEDALQFFSDLAKQHPDYFPCILFGAVTDNIRSWNYSEIYRIHHALLATLEQFPLVVNPMFLFDFREEVEGERVIGESPSKDYTAEELYKKFLERRRHGWHFGGGLAATPEICIDSKGAPVGELNWHYGEPVSTSAASIRKLLDELGTNLESLAAAAERIPMSIRTLPDVQSKEAQDALFAVINHELSAPEWAELSARALTDVGVKILPRVLDELRHGNGDIQKMTLMWLVLRLGQGGAEVRAIITEIRDQAPTDSRRKRVGEYAGIVLRELEE